MREILFKAKRTDNAEWVEGYLYRISEEQKPFIMCINRNAESYEVDPSTICQYTGLTDKNGKKVWENDIARIDDDWIGRIIWKNEDTAFVVFPSNDIEHETYCVGYYANECEIEVIGNIFDNSE